jgi:outer membrane receptor protein involved in Fe transport
LVQSIDVLTGGASTDYGADALVGVVNFKLKRDFEGIELDQTFEIHQHDNGNSPADALLARNAGGPIAVPGSQLDGFVRQSTIIAGADGANGKSNVTIYATDAHTDPIFQSARDFSACTIQGIGPDGALRCGGSVNSPQGAFFLNVAPNPDGTFPSGPNTAGPGAGGFATTNPNGTASFLPVSQAGLPLFNTEPQNALLREDQRYNFGGFAHYEVAPWADLYTEFGFLDDRTTEQVAAGGLFLGGAFVNVNCNNPFLGQQQALSIGCGDPNYVGQFGASPGQVGIFLPGLRFSQPRQVNFDHTDYRLLVGSRGELPYGFNYDVSASYYTTVEQTLNTGFASLTKVQDALLVTTNAAGQPVCISGTARCVPLNIFSRNGSVAAQSNVLQDALTVGSSTEVVAQTNISGDLGQFGVKSPLAKNGVAVVGGFEYRFENLTSTPDAEQSSGDLIGLGGTPQPINGSFDDQDFFGEIHAPLIEDLPFAKAVDLDLGLRHSGYAIYGTAQTFDTNTYKIQGDWQIIDDVRLRGGYNQALRAPNIIELFSPQATSLFAFADPCAGATPTATLAQCERSGVTPAQFGHIAQCPANQCVQLTGGNPAVRPELGETYTWGAVLTPTFIPNLLFSADYYTINISNLIGTQGSSNIVNGCVQNNALCNLIHRGPNGILFAQNGPGFVQATESNVSGAVENGLDLSAQYRHSLDFLHAGNLGDLTFNYTGNVILQDISFQAGTPSSNCAGLYGTECGTPTSTYRHSLRTTWISPWDVNVSLNWRHLSGVQLDVNSTQPALAGTFNPVSPSISAFDYFDLSATWNVKENLKVTVGVNNLFDRDPPLVDGLITGDTGFGGGNTYPGQYDALGRTMFVTASVKF